MERLRLLQGIFKEEDGVTEIKLIDARCNVLHLIIKLLHNAPSSTEIVHCSNINCQYSNIERSSPTIIVRLKNGFKSLENSLENYIMSKNTKCNLCNENVITTKILQDHIFIETDVLGDNAKFSLMDFPHTLQIQNSRYTSHLY